MIEIRSTCFSLEQICQSGQCFRMNKEIDKNGNEYYYLIAFGKYLKLIQKDDIIYLDCNEEDYYTIWFEYFDLATDYEMIIKNIDREDKYLTKSAEYGNGIRILKQDIWEMIISFIISQQNNIRRIRKCIGILCERYGEKRITDDGIEYYAFPTAEVLSKITIEELNECNLGYRSKYISDTAKRVASGYFDIEKLSRLEYVEARKELLSLFGVGVKVADCICLFTLHHTDAFPIDTHINNVLSVHYSDGFPFERYRGVNGILQQYVFYFDLMKQDDNI